MPKAQLALEYIVRVMIALVVIGVVVSLILKFKEDIRIMVKKIFGETEIPQSDFPKIIDNKKTFNPGEILTYVEDCHYTMASLTEDKQEDIVCYVLIPKEGFSITKTELENVISNSNMRDEVYINPNLDLGKSFIKIQYQDAGNIINITQ